MPVSGRIDELRKRYEENPRRFFAPLANEYRKSGELEQAIDLCRMHLADAPANLNGQIVFGQALYDSGTLDEARGAFEAAIALDPENLIALRHLGDIAREQGDIPTARRWYQRVLDADRRNEDVLAIMDELAAVEAAGHAIEPSERQAVASGGVDTIELEEPPMRAPAPSRPSIMSLIGEQSASERRVSAEEVASVPDETVEEVAEIETGEVQEPEREAAQAPDNDAIDFGMVDPGQSAPRDEPGAPPESSFGLDVDLGAAADIPVATSMGDTGDFGQVELEDDAPFRETEAVNPPEVETAANSLAGNIELHEPIDIETAAEAAAGTVDFPEPIDLDSFDETPVDSIEAPAEPEPPKLKLVKSADVLDTIDLDGDEDIVDISTAVEAPPQPAETMPRRSTPVVFNFDLSVDTPPRSATPLEPVAAQEKTESEVLHEPIDEAVPSGGSVEEDIRDLPTPIIQPAVEAFATETMAELYVKQGLRHEAISVYKQLVEARPGDKALRDRLAELEDDGHVAAGSTARAFFAALSRRTSKGRASGANRLPDTSPPRGSLDRLFGGASVARLDEHAAESLSAAFGSGPAQHEESALDRVFTSRPATPPR